MKNPKRRTLWRVIILTKEGEALSHWIDTTKKAAEKVAKDTRKSMGKPMGRKVKVIKDVYHRFEIVDLKERNTPVATFRDEPDALAFCEGKAYRFGYRTV